MSREIVERCQVEVLGLHGFFTDWFAGSLPKSDVGFQRCVSAFHADFSMVVSNGDTLDRKTVLKHIYDGHASRTKKPFTIEIRNVGAIDASDTGALVVYEEVQLVGGRIDNVRASTAYFVTAPATPSGVAWRHLHETRHGR